MPPKNEPTSDGLGQVDKTNVDKYLTKKARREKRISMKSSIFLCRESENSEDVSLKKQVIENKHDTDGKVILINLPFIHHSFL